MPWTVVDRSVATNENRRPLKVKWVYDLKLDVTTKKLRYKARIVGCGYAQIEGIDYQQTFASTIRAVTIRLFFAEVATRDLHTKLIDVIKAFTHSAVKERLFIELPKGFEEEGKIGLLHQALEGLKQSANLWQDLLCSVLTSFGLVRSTRRYGMWIQQYG
jgi:hypothetical protein